MKMILYLILFIVSSNLVLAQKAKQFYYYEDKKVSITLSANSTFMIEMKKLEPGEEKIYFFTIKPSNSKTIKNYGLISISLEMQYITNMKDFRKIKDKERIKWIDENSVIVSSEIIDSISEYFNMGVLNVMLSESGK